MGIITNGIHGNFVGRIGDTVCYMLGNKNVCRKIGVRTKPFTVAQLRYQLITKISSELFCTVRDFIETGFSIEARKVEDNAYNQAVKHNKKNILIGDYPNLKLNVEHILLSKGDLKPVEDLEVTQIPLGLQFNWKTDPKMAWPDAADQVMLLAFFPEQNRAEYELFGNTRISGNATLEIPPSLQGAYMETYISFISADRTQVSDSVYTGSFNKPEVTDHLSSIS